MQSETSDPKDPWETPPIELDPELIATSQRLVSLSEASSGKPLEGKSASSKSSPADPYVTLLESRNKYLFNRNIELVARVAALESANLRLQAQISELKRSHRSDSPWYSRWFSSRQSPSSRSDVID
ncbi:hypothetical protein [Altericista sp. CCNU0014]|uniref:hypothetical protein n=1 Tax=Altericista sp. CCNU0014 TaxID=3082949 RepID=UPI00384C40FC